MGTRPPQVTRILGSANVASQSYTSQGGATVQNQMGGTGYGNGSFPNVFSDDYDTSVAARNLGIDPSLAQKFSTGSEGNQNNTKQVGGSPNSLNILAGFGGSAVGVTGVEGSVGLAVNIGFALNPALRNQGPQTAFFGSVGTGGGINASGDIFVGYIEGGINDVAGSTFNLNSTAGFVSLTVFTNPQTGKTVGGTLGFGPSATGFGVSGTYSNTGILRLD